MHKSRSRRRGEYELNHTSSQDSSDRRPPLYTQHSTPQLPTGLYNTYPRVPKVGKRRSSLISSLLKSRRARRQFYSSSAHSVQSPYPESGSAVLMQSPPSDTSGVPPRSSLQSAELRQASTESLPNSELVANITPRSNGVENNTESSTIQPCAPSFEELPAPQIGWALDKPNTPQYPLENPVRLTKPLPPYPLNDSPKFPVPVDTSLSSFKPPTDESAQSNSGETCNRTSQPREPLQPPYPSEQCVHPPYPFEQPPQPPYPSEQSNHALCRREESVHPPNSAAEPSQTPYPPEQTVQSSHHNEQSESAERTTLVSQADQDYTGQTPNINEQPNLNSAQASNSHGQSAHPRIDDVEALSSALFSKTSISSPSDAPPPYPGLTSPQRLVASRKAVPSQHSVEDSSLPPPYPGDEPPANLGENSAQARRTQWSSSGNHGQTQTPEILLILDSLETTGPERNDFAPVTISNSELVDGLPCYLCVKESLWRKCRSTEDKCKMCSRKFKNEPLHVRCEHCGSHVMTKIETSEPTSFLEEIKSLVNSPKAKHYCPKCSKFLGTENERHPIEKLYHDIANDLYLLGYGSQDWVNLPTFQQYKQLMTQATE